VGWNDYSCSNLLDAICEAHEGEGYKLDRKNIKSIIQKKLNFNTHKMYGEYNSNENESKCLRNNAFVNLLLSDSEDDTKLRNIYKIEGFFKLAGYRNKWEMHECCFNFNSYNIKGQDRIILHLVLQEVGSPLK
jgi:hypothetical protein